ncbi:NBS-LRR type resistance protein [Cucumis melo var. makuwa]|uniref:NBS-LRR type resistance protein n=1 Tax=Cucumis melo var. makuwa TaxID=1194695 RepID=A0A5D3B9D2_CUCMM|nr:NBS-LRR type resistance protein [Cucumis melo var. makuwa]
MAFMHPSCPSSVCPSPYHYLKSLKRKRNTHINQSSDPVRCTYQSSDPEGCTYQSRNPEGYTYQSSDPEGCTYQSRDPKGCTYQSRDLEGCTYQSSDPVGCTYQSSDPEGHRVYKATINDWFQAYDGGGCFTDDRRSGSRSKMKGWPTRLRVEATDDHPGTQGGKRERRRWRSLQTVGWPVWRTRRWLTVRGRKTGTCGCDRLDEGEIMRMAAVIVG